VKRLLGGVLLAIGILMMTGSGLCSLYVIASMGMLSAPQMILLPLIFGGIPFGGGFGLFYAGRIMLRRPERLDEDELNDRFG